MGTTYHVLRTTVSNTGAEYELSLSSLKSILVYKMLFTSPRCVTDHSLATSCDRIFLNSSLEQGSSLITGPQEALQGKDLQDSVLQYF